jgi:hypothetical protein
METRFLPHFNSLLPIGDFIQHHGNRMCPPANIAMRVVEVKPFPGGWCCTLVDFLTPDAEVPEIMFALLGLPHDRQASFTFILYVFGVPGAVGIENMLVPGARVVVVAVSKMITIGTVSSGCATLDDVFYV